MLLKGITKNITSEEGRFFSFFKPLMSVGLQLMKNVLAPLAKSISVTFWLTVAA